MSAKHSISAATGTSHQAMMANIAIGVSAAMASCGTYWPKKVCNCSTPSTTDSMTPPVRSPANQAGPSSVDLVVELEAQDLLHARSGAVRHHGALVLEKRANEHDRRDRRRRHKQRRGRRAAEDERKQRAQKHETRNADDGRRKPHEHGGDDPPPHPAR